MLYGVDAHVATITINRPELRNSLSWQVMAELKDALAIAGQDPDVRAVVLTGSGDRTFCAGADLAGLANPDDISSLHDGIGAMPGLLQELWAVGKPTIARVFGHCLAGGFGLALACDFVIASDDATFGTPEINLGVWPYVITVPIRNSMPTKKALELLMTGRRVDAAEAERIGFVNRVVPRDHLDQAVDELASSLVSKAPTAMRLGRKSFYDTLGLPANMAFGILQPLLTVTASTPEAAEGLRAFRERREPGWSGANSSE